MFKIILLIVLYFQNIFCSGYIYNIKNPHSPCQKSYSFGFCVPTKHCCLDNLYNSDNYERGNCAIGKFCCPQDQVKCQECLAGFEEKGGICVDTNECASIRYCSGHNCVNTNGSYECECFDNFELIGIEKTCRHTNQSEIIDLLFTESFKINLIKFSENEVKTENTKMLFSGSVYPKSIDYSFGGNYMAWTDISSKLISIAPVNYRHPSSIIDRIIIRNVNHPYILSIDWIHDLIYWTDLETKAINVLNINRPYDYYTVVNNINEMSTDFKVNVLDSCLVWTFVGLRPRIMRSFQDGSNQTVLYSSDKQPFYITIDIHLKRYFFVDIGKEELYTIDFKGNQGTIEISIFTTIGILSNLITSPTIYGDTIYFSTESKVYSYNKLNKHITDSSFGNMGKSPRNSESSRLFDFKIMDTLLQPNLENKCLHSQCSHICVPSDESSVYRCLCPQNYVLINNSICFEKQIQNFLIEAINREKNFQILFNYVINKTFGETINKTKNTKHEFSYNITHLIEDNRNEGKDVFEILILLSLFLIIILMIGFTLKKHLVKVTKCSSQGHALYQSSVRGSTDETESKF